MSRGKLIDALRLFHNEMGGSRRNPDIKFIQQLAPHLEPAEIGMMLLRARDGLLVEFIGPPVAIRGAEHVYSFELSSTGILFLTWKFCYRRHESYAQVGDKPPRWGFTEFDYRERVADYAELTYGESLIWDTGKQFVHYERVNPRLGGSAPGDFAFASYNATWESMVTHAATRCPLPQILDQRMVMATRELFVAAEMMGAAVPMLALNCAFCGGGMGLTKCHFCHHPLERNPLNHDFDWAVPIHLSLCEAVDWGSKFSHHPINAIKACYAQWAATGFTSPGPPVLREDRVITLRE